MLALRASIDSDHSIGTSETELIEADAGVGHRQELNQDEKVVDLGIGELGESMPLCLLFGSVEERQLYARPPPPPPPQ